LTYHRLLKSALEKVESNLTSAKTSSRQRKKKSSEGLVPLFKVFVNNLITDMSYPLDILKNLIIDDDKKLQTKQFLDKIRTGDLSELTEQLNVFYTSYNQKNLLSLLDPLIKGEYKEEVKAQFLNIYGQLKEFYDSSKEWIVDFLRKATDLLIDANDIQEAILMKKEFMISSEDQLYEFTNKSERLLNDAFSVELTNILKQNISLGQREFPFALVIY
jgi:hypothetical protein